jgi:pyruvate,water dikinase
LRASLDDEQIVAITDAVIAIEQHYGYPVDIEWVLDRHRREGEPIAIVQTRPVTVVEQAASTAYDPMALANRFIFSKGR